MHLKPNSGAHLGSRREPFSTLRSAGQLAKKITPWQMRRWLRRQERRIQHSIMPLRRVSDFGAFRRLEPIAPDFGWSRGQCIDRYYIEKFLSDNAGDIRGGVLEFQNDAYTKRLGGPRVSNSEVIDLSSDNPQATIVADISQRAKLPTRAFDCIICTQVLQLVFNMKTALRSLYELLKPGGVLLLTVPGIAHKVITSTEGEDCWRFTTASIQRLFEEVFGKENFRVEPHGNVLSAMAFLHGLAAEELTRAELDYLDPQYQVTVAVRAVRG
jgi:SAM-dependent methyltransferase